MQKHDSIPTTFPVVCIGAASGGENAIENFIGALPQKTGMAYIIALQLSHSYTKDQLKAFRKEVSIDDLTDETVLQPDHVYIIPENKVFTVSDGVLKLADRNPKIKKTMVLDQFFKSASEKYKSFTIGIVLSGNGFDGSEGLKTIKENGGITYAQSPDSATHNGMPQSAIDSGAVDFILLPEDMPQHLLHIKNAYQVSHSYSEDPDSDRNDNDSFRQIIKLLRLRTGNDFTHYKQPTLRRRIARRMVATRNEVPEAYLAYLKENKEEQDALFNDVLIPVSYFFRDSKTFETLCEAVLPVILKQKKTSESIRIWVAGCSTGEEAYSLAICLHEHLTARNLSHKVQIFATDISEKVISQARAAMYTQQEVATISEERLAKYFTKIDRSYHINKVIRDMCIFAVHNFLKDPPFAKLDMLSCRNVLIYLDQFLQKKALTTFHYALKDNAVLFLGKSEATTSVGNLFEPIIKNHKIFARKPVLGRLLPSSFEPVKLPAPSKNATVKKAATAPDLHAKAAEIILSEFTPAGVIINESREIVHFLGDTIPFLAPSPGKPSFNILKMARNGLGFELRNALAKIEGQRLKSGRIALKNENYLVTFEIIPLVKEPEQHLLILFSKIDVSDEQLLFLNGADTDGFRVKQLETELEQLREDIRRVTEVQEVANEELQSANEELLSNSEEMQSLNEELETSAEELQSNNEELISVNDELMDRQEQLISARMYAEAIVETINEPLVIFDKNLRIKSANRAFYKYFQTTEFDTDGRLLYELGGGQWNNAALLGLLRNILPNKSKISDFEITGNFPVIGQKTMLLNAMQIVNGRHYEQLILMAITDVTELKLSKILKESESRFRLLADTAPVVLWISNSEQKWTFFNKSWLDFRGKSLEQETGTQWKEGIYADDIALFDQVYDQSYKKQREFNIEFRLQRHDGAYRWIAYRGVPRFGNNGEFLGFIGGAMDIDEQKTFSASLEAKVEARTKELKASEGFLQSVLNTTQNLIYVYDFEKKNIVFINDNAVEVTGHKPAEITQSSEDVLLGLIHQDDVDAFEKHRAALFESEDSGMRTIEFRLWNGKEWAYQFSRDKVFQRNESGVTQYIGVATDISEIRNINEELLVKNRELQAKNIELASFTSIASHDLKEPLRKIMMFSRLVVDADKQNVSEISRNYLDRIVYSADRMQHLIDDLISYSRTAGEKIRYQKASLNELLDKALDELEEVIKHKNVTIDADALPVAPVVPSQIVQLFLNLISNAIKYSRKDAAPHISIKLHRPDRDELTELKVNPDTTGYYKITVADNGIGFRDEFHQLIFEPFKRLHSNEEFPGTGIGLAICKKIVENHKGFIQAQGKIGHGSVFCIYLPDGIRKKYPN